MNDFPVELRRPLVPNGCRRAPWHDYRSRCIYMITLNVAENMPPLSELRGIPGNHDWPPVAVNLPAGRIVASKISALKLSFPFIKILRRVIMPDHVHFVLFVERGSEYHIGDIISHLKGECTRQMRLDSGCPENRSFFEDGYHDRILLKEGQLQRMLDYVSDNPRRRLLRLMNPGFHRRRFIRTANGVTLETYGNIGLLSDPDIEPVIISRKYSSDQLRSLKICWKRTVENGGVLISPFISQSEKRVLEWAIENGGRIIQILDNGFGERFAPKGRLHTLCDEGRILLVAPCEHSLTPPKISRRSCMEMNGLARELADFRG